MLFPSMRIASIVPLAQLGAEHLRRKL